MRRIAQAITNLLVNAAKYTPAAGQVSLRLLLHPDHGRLSVVDSGVCIPAGMLANVFEPYAQVPSSHAMAQEGLGIGLALVQRVRHPAAARS